MRLRGRSRRARRAAAALNATVAAPDRLRLALDHIAEALDDLTALTSALDEAAFRLER